MLNYQVFAEPTVLNRGKFADNGGCGYVLKPALLSGKGSATKAELTVMVLRGRQLPKPMHDQKGEVIDPYVEIALCGFPQDTALHKTQVVQNNGFMPEWHEEFVFEISCCEMAMLRVSVYDKDMLVDDFIGAFALPVCSIRDGYRVVPLLDHNHELIPHAIILCKFELRFR